MTLDEEVGSDNQVYPLVGLYICMMILEKNGVDTGVSPVVGVILMVAITVILSAIVATFVLEQVGSGSENPAAGVSFDQQPDTDGDGTGSYEVAVQAVSMESADYLKVSSTASSDYTGGFSDADGDGTAQELQQPGDKGVIHDLQAGDRVTVTATLEGNTQVIQTFTVN